MAKIKATHSGECQVCGRRQKLPGGRLSQHGYTVQWSMFLGVCGGAHELPFEQSKDVAEEYRARAQKQRDDLQEEMERWLQPATEQKAWVHEYVKEKNLSYGYAKGHYEWHYVDIIVENVPFNDGNGSYNNYSWVGVDGKSQKIHAHDDDVLQVMTEMNRQYARSIENNIKQIESYLSWMDGRLKNWAPKELKPAEAM